SQRAFQLHHEQVGRAALELQLGVKLSNERERVKLNQHVVADLTMHTEPRSRSEKLSACAKLHRVRSQSKVRLAAQSRIVAVGKIDRDTVEFRKVRRRIESRMQATDSEREVRRRTPLHPHRHVAGQSKLVQQTRIMQRRIKRGGTLVEVDHTDCVHLQAHEFTIRTRQNGKHLRE